MSLEMVADPEFTFTDRTEGLDELSGTLSVLHRRGLTNRPGREDDDSGLPPAATAGELKPDLRLELLTAGQRELRGSQAIDAATRALARSRTATSAASGSPVHRGLRLRQSFDDGVCVAELLVVRPAQGNPVGGRRGNGDSGQFRQPAPPRHLRPGVRIASAVVGKDA